jgi:hypothetical protein
VRSFRQVCRRFVLRGQALKPIAAALTVALVASCASPAPLSPVAPVVHVTPAKTTGGDWLRTGPAAKEIEPVDKPDAEGRWSAGDTVEVEWHGVWYAASVLEVESEGRYRIHYEGYGREWDEVVDEARIREAETEDDETP